MKNAENPAPDLFTTYERLEVCHRTEVTVDNVHLLAQHFGWSVNYAGDEPRLQKIPAEAAIEIGAWIDWRGSRWNPEPLSQGWFAEGTHALTHTPDPTTATEQGAPNA